MMKMLVKRATLGLVGARILPAVIIIFLIRRYLLTLWGVTVR